MWPELLRSLLAWPLWSRRRAGTILAVVLVAVWTASVLHAAAPDRPRPAPSAAATVVAPEPTGWGEPSSPPSEVSGTDAPGWPTSDTEDTEAPPTSEDVERTPPPGVVTGAPTVSAAPQVQAAARLAADTAVRAWARPGLAAPAWLAALQPAVTARFAALLASVDPARVPARRVDGQPSVVTSTAEEVLVDVRTDAGVVHVSVRQERGRWLVDSITPGQSAPTVTGPTPVGD